MKINLVKKVLENLAYKFTEVPNEDIIQFSVKGKNGELNCIAYLQKNSNRLIFISRCGTNAPKEKRGDILKLLNDINFKLLAGNFVMDMEDGEIRLKSNVSYKHLDLNAAFVEDLILSNLIIMDENLPSIIGLMQGT